MGKAKNEMAKGASRVTVSSLQHGGSLCSHATLALALSEVMRCVTTQSTAARETLVYPKWVRSMANRDGAIFKCRKKKKKKTIDFYFWTGQSPILLLGAPLTVILFFRSVWRECLYLERT